MKMIQGHLIDICRNSSISICILISLISLPAHAGDTETNAVKYCISSGAVEPEAFAYCVGTYLTKEEIKKCLTGGDCFGESNDLRKALEQLGINFGHIQQYGWCGGPNSTARQIFGNGICGCGGPERKVVIENNTGGTVHLGAEGSCNSGITESVPNGSNVTISGEGDEWFNVSVNSNGRTITYGLDPGMRYAFLWQGNQLTITNTTPRFAGGVISTPSSGGAPIPAGFPHSGGGAPNPGGFPPSP